VGATIRRGHTGALAVVEHHALARLLKIAFDAVWAQGLAFDELAARREPVAAPRA
jgi:hypothetical protein